MSQIRQQFFEKWKDHAPRDAARKALQCPPEGVNAVRNVPYKAVFPEKEEGETEQDYFLDVFFPEEFEGILPVIVDVHGGGWVYGNKELNEYYCMELAKLGFVVFDINYRLIPKTDLKGQIQDVTTALNWVFEHALEYRGNAKSVSLTGDSAGAQLALLVCAASSKELYRRIYELPELNGKVAALGLTCPVTCLHEMSRSKDEMQREWMRVIYGIAEGKEDGMNSSIWNYSDPNDFLKECSMPEVYILTTEGDVNYYWQAEELHRILQENGIKHTYRVWEAQDDQELGHVFNVLYPANKNSRDANREMTLFFI